MKQQTTTRLLWVIGIPVAYALLLRFVFDIDLFRNFAQVMSLTFFVSLPFGVGILTIALSPLEKIKKIRYRLMMPWLPILFFFVITIVLSIEGWACWLMILPVFLAFASLGGLVAGYFKLRKFKQEKQLNVSCICLLPLGLLFVENAFPVLPATYKTYTFIDIHAPRAEIWRHVTRVAAISAGDDRGNLSNWLGFPRPVKAELDIEAVGGSRKALFTGGLVFDEVVNFYRHQQEMHFSIKANPYNIPSTTMDKHVVIGGDYFDVLDGAYRLEQLNKSTWRLHLYSHFELHTSFNFYASCWAGWIMKDIQNNILQVIKTRSESARYPANKTGLFLL